MTEKLAADSGAERAARRILPSIRTELRYASETVECLAAIIREETGTQWIPVGERLPAIGQWAWVVIGGVTQRMAAQYCGITWEWADISADSAPKEVVTYWMPLPAAPDEGGKR